MAKTTDAITYEKLYTLVDQKMGTVNASIVRLETKFDTLADGRIATLEKQVSDLKAELATNKGQNTMIPVLVSVAISVFGIIVSFVLRS